MEDIQSIIQESKKSPKLKNNSSKKSRALKVATTSEIPDLFFDEVLTTYKLSRIDIIVLMYLYRIVWCKPNLHKSYGISPIVEYSRLAELLDISVEKLQFSLRSLENLEFIETLRYGQYFVRKYFTKENDRLYGQFYEGLVSK